MADFYKDIEARIHAAMQSGQKLDTGMHTARQLGKSRLLGMMYGNKPTSLDQWAKVYQSQREHPMQYASQFNFVGREPRFGNLPVYKVQTKVTSEIICKKEKVPHTDVYYGDLFSTGSDLPDVVGLVWTRHMKMGEIELAAATMIMLGKEVAVLRAFEP